MAYGEEKKIEPTKQTEQSKQTSETEPPKFDLYCPKCELVIPEEPEVINIFCPDCGNRLSRPSRCIFCNNLIHPENLFCTGCGIGRLNQYR
jgi:membrane protease subunit (stomatin/prohibitin family)